MALPELAGAKRPTTLTCIVDAAEAARAFVNARPDQRLKRWLGREGVRRVVHALQTAGFDVVLVESELAPCDGFKTFNMSDPVVDKSRVRFVRTSSREETWKEVLLLARASDQLFAQDLTSSAAAAVAQAEAALHPDTPAVDASGEVVSSSELLLWSAQVRRGRQVCYTFDDRGGLQFLFPASVNRSLLRQQRPATSEGAIMVKAQPARRHLRPSGCGKEAWQSIRLGTAPDLQTRSRPLPVGFDRPRTVEPSGCAVSLDFTLGLI